MKKLQRIEILALIIVLLVIAVAAFGGGVPQVIHYQGTLNNKSGTPVSGTFNMGFRIYSSATGNTPLWSENWSAAANPPNPIIATNGSFNVMLGSLTPFPSDFFVNNPKTYLGITVGSDSEMTPRQPIASVAYALSAGSSIPKGGIIMWSGAINQVPDGWALCDGANGTPDLRDRFIVGIGSNTPAGPGDKNGNNYTVNLSHSHTINTTDTNHQHYADHTHTGTTGSSNSNKSRNEGSSSSFTLPATDHGHSFTTGGMSRGGNTDWMDRNQSHTHTENAQLTTPIDIRPPYYALAFIMKL